MNGIGYIIVFAGCAAWTTLVFLVGYGFGQSHEARYELAHGTDVDPEFWSVAIRAEVSIRSALDRCRKNAPKEDWADLPENEP